MRWRLFVVLGACGLAAGCVCQPESIPCDSPTLGEGLEEERCVPGGTYVIGADAIPVHRIYLLPDGGECTKEEVGQNGCRDPNWVGAPRNDWAPKHEVRLSPFYIDTYEVTNGRYRACVEAGACTRNGFTSNPPTWYAASEADKPHVFATWSWANDYCSWRGKQLPTEAQWEVAGRGKEASKYPWGNGVPDPSQSWGGDSPPFDPVGTDPQDVSPFGVHDLSGSTAEWVRDWYGGAYEAGTADNPTGPSGPQSGGIRCCKEDNWRTMYSWNGDKVFRGTRRGSPGGYELQILKQRYPLWVRDMSRPDDSMGFRCVREGKAGTSQQGLHSVPVYRDLKWRWYGGSR